MNFIILTFKQLFKKGKIMRCPYCFEDNDKVIDSRPNKDNDAIRRRRLCNKCGKRFTTYEYTEKFPLQIIKKDGRREDFKREKILTGLLIACRKRRVPMKKIEKTADEIHDLLIRKEQNEISSAIIGELIMDKLQELDQVAYVRFASVYKEFKDIKEFKKTIDRLFTESDK